jgi:hypothetical protein
MSTENDQGPSAEEIKSTQAQIKKLMAQLEKTLKDLLEQAKKLDLHVDLKPLRENISKFDKKQAREKFEQLREAGVAEATRIRGRVQTQMQQLNTEVAKSSERMKTEVEKLRGRVQEGLVNLKSQVKAMAEAERAKRRGGS